MHLSAKKRAGEKKSEIKEIRRNGNIPAVFYSPKNPGQSIEINGAEFQAAMRKIKPGRLATTIFDLDYDGKKMKVLVKDIQYDLTSYQITHLDFEELKEDVPVEVKVPIECVGEEDCVGVKLGGFMRQIIRHLEVECLPKHIPAEFAIDVRELELTQSKKISAIAMPKGVKPLAKMDEIVVIIARR